MIDKIDKVGYSKPVSAAKAAAIKRAGGADGAAFAEALARAEDALGVDGPSAPAAAAPITSSGLLGLQEVNEEELARQKCLRHGRLTLDALTALRDGLLSGRMSLSSLRALENLVAAERVATADPLLLSVMNEIETRAAVELAKLEMSGVRS